MRYFKYAETEHERDSLMPCPFCKTRSAVLVVQQIAGVPEADDVCFVRCKHCYAQGPATGDESRCIVRWNAGMNDAFNPVLVALENLYERFCAGGDVPSSVAALIQAYDEWLG